VKLGKRPATHDRRDLLFEAYATDRLRPPSMVKASLHAFRDWLMLGNDQYGDCVFAGADHETMLLNKLGGKVVSFGSEEALSDYSAVTGFNPDDPSTDQGTNVRDALTYRRHTGVVDAKHRRHKIGAFAALEVGNVQHIKEAIHLFGVVGVGIEFPASAMDQFNEGKPWAVVPGAQIEGGHYVPAIGYGPRSVYVVSWGRVVEMSWQFFATYTDEAWAILSSEFLTKGRSPQGFLLKDLKADLAAL
jgi:hypothetical protein